MEIESSSILLTVKSEGNILITLFIPSVSVCARVTKISYLSSLV